MIKTGRFLLHEKQNKSVNYLQNEAEKNNSFVCFFTKIRMFIKSYTLYQLLVNLSIVHVNIAKFRNYVM